MKVIFYTLLAYSINIAKTHASNSDLARISILDFTDKTNKNFYGWLSSSASDSVTYYMHQRFEFHRVSAAEIKKKVVQKGYLKNITVKKAKAIAAFTDSDMLIYGDYLFDPKKNKLIIHAYIYSNDKGKVIAAVRESTATDNRIFESADNMASKIIKHIYASIDSNKPISQPNTFQKKRVFVLASAQTDLESYSRAMSEATEIKSYISKKFHGRFLALQKLFQVYKITSPEKRVVNGYVSKRQSQKLIEWLKKWGIRDAMIIFVNNNQVKLSPIIDGKPSTEFNYSSNAPAKEKFGQLESVLLKASFEKKIVAAPKKVKLKKKVKSTLVQSVILTAAYPFAKSFSTNPSGLALNQKFPLDEINGAVIISAGYQIQHLFIRNLLLGGNLSTLYGTSTPTLMYTDGTLSNQKSFVSITSFEATVYSGYYFKLPWMLQIAPVAGGGISYQRFVSSGNVILDTPVAFPLLGLYLSRSIFRRVDALIVILARGYLYQKTSQNMLATTFGLGVRYHL